MFHLCSCKRELEKSDVIYKGFAKTLPDVHYYNCLFCQTTFTKTARKELDGMELKEFLTVIAEKIDRKGGFKS